MTNHYTTDFKLKIVKMILEEELSKHEIERTYSVARKTQRDWVSKYKHEGMAVLVNKKKQMKQNEYQIIDKFKSIFYIKDLCDYLGIHKSGYYRYLKRKTYQTHQEKTKNHLKMLIKNYHEIYPTKGYRAIRKDILDETGWIVSYYLMYRCFREMEIFSKVSRRAFRRPKHQSNKFPNLVHSNWSTSRPFEIVCSDTTMLVINGKKYDWNFHIDVFNNEMVDWDLANYKHGMGVMNHLKSLKEFLRIKEERGYGNINKILHSDQGNIYASKKFEQVHKDYKVTRSMSRVATPTDNAVIESLNGWIKSDLKKNLRIHDFQDRWKAIEIYVNYFNKNRPSWKLDYLSPVEYRTINGVK